MMTTDPNLADPNAGFPRISSGNPDVDKILGGGFPANSINIIISSRGSRAPARPSSCSKWCLRTPATITPYFI